MIDIVILLGSFVVLCMIGMPVAYTLGLAAILGATLAADPTNATFDLGTAILLGEDSTPTNGFSLMVDTSNPIYGFVTGTNLVVDGALTRGVQF